MKKYTLIKLRKLLIFSVLFLSFSSVNFDSSAQHTSARIWNDVLLDAIRNDFARPTVHARNLYHTSLVMYDAWAAYGGKGNYMMLGDTSFNCPFTGVTPQADINTERETAISYAMYRLLRYRFRNSPGKSFTYNLMDSIFILQGHDTNFVSMDYDSLGAAALGNYLANCIIEYGKTDGSNDTNDYVNTYYSPYNPTLLPDFPGNPDIIDPNRWQPLTLQFFIDQAGNPLPINTPPFLSPEWGIVKTFAMHDSVKTDHFRGPDPYPVFHDPGPPLMLDTMNGGTESERYKWNFNLVNIWSSHLDPADSVVWDVSPGAIGNISSLPDSVAQYSTFYDLYNGGQGGTGHTLNPATGQPYAPNLVYRGDYARVLAEFWADGPDSETPPGHWFTLLNYVSDHAAFQRKWNGQGPVLDELEWEVKSYLALGGTMHDVAISAWGCKGWYDYIRPISAIRYMADQGQCSDTTLSNYNKNGIPLDSGYVEVVMVGDPLQGASMEHVGKIKVRAWRGPDYIVDPEVDHAGVGWILMENWWPYQRPSFVTPPFAGYVSGHSTYSRAAADLFTYMTGSNYFPGGMGVFPAIKDEFLVFEEGPSKTVTLQWATYQDASDECSLSRIWGGIHPPTDDIPGRRMGIDIAKGSVSYIEDLFNSEMTTIYSLTANKENIVRGDTGIASLCISVVFDHDMDTSVFPTIKFPDVDLSANLIANNDSTEWINSFTYNVYYDVVDLCVDLSNVNVRVSGAKNASLADVDSATVNDVFSIYMQNEVDLSATNVNCFGEQTASIDLTPLSGNSPFIYNWSNGATTQDLDSLASGTYSVTVTDTDGCVGSATVAVTQPAAISVTSSKSNISCNNQDNGSAAVFVSGGVPSFSYNWSNGSTTSNISSLSGGAYTCTITDNNACTSTKVVNIFNPSAILAFTIKDNPGPGDINLLVSGGINPYSYNWSTGATTEDLF
ncbi:MAG: hypothetical protein HKN22_04310, partial [Bacteroidia bacterium]|nr:hypothetical protein [Bacteroidia bacterium]